MSTLPGRPTCRNAGLQPTSAVYLRPCSEQRCVCPFYPHLSLSSSYHPTPSLFNFFTAPFCCPALRAPMSIHTHRPSHPHQGPSSTAPALGFSAAPRVPARPAKTGGEGPLGQPPSAAQPRPFAHGRGTAQTQPPALDVLPMSPTQAQLLPL